MRYGACYTPRQRRLNPNPRVLSSQNEGNAGSLAGIRAKLCSAYTHRHTHVQKLRRSLPKHRQMVALPSFERAQGLFQALSRVLHGPKKRKRFSLRVYLPRRLKSQWRKYFSICPNACLPSEGLVYDLRKHGELASRARYRARSIAISAHRSHAVGFALMRASITVR